jgi:hypothetical protein
MYRRGAFIFFQDAMCVNLCHIFLNVAEPEHQGADEKFEKAVVNS